MKPGWRGGERWTLSLTLIEVVRVIVTEIGMKPGWRGGERWTLSLTLIVRSRSCYCN